MDFIVNFDWAVFKFFEKLWNPVLDVIMSVITYLGDDGIFWIILGVCLLIPKKTRRFGVYVLGGLAVAGFINNICLKELIQRPQYPAPKFRLNPDIKDFYDFTIDDIIIEDYRKNPQILNIPIAI